MTATRQRLLDRIRIERERQLGLPGSEWDQRNTPNDWVAIAGTYLLRDTGRKNQTPRADDFADSLVKAAAVVLAALEHVDTMTGRDLLPAPPAGPSDDPRE